jgi:hypothetical protein
MGEVLEEIQRAQFTDRPRAERLLLDFVRDTFPLDVVSVRLRPLAVSLNSFNGFLDLADGRQLFFKTHTEPGSVIGEYYNAASLARAGYPVLQPLFGSTESGRQLLIYEVVDDPSVFDIAWRVENGERELLKPLTAAQRASDEQLDGIYQATLGVRRAEAATAPVHQLFYHRLTGPRFRQFYPLTGTVELPGTTLAIPELFARRWVVNGQSYVDSLNAMTTRAVRLLTPAMRGPSVIGHGDAHNGNVFFHERTPGLVYFDPAFAGRHDPLLDLAKPLFHNVFAMWMYYPGELRDRLHITASDNGDTITVSHDHDLLPVRRMFLESKIELVLTPLIEELRRRGWLRVGWRERLKAALLCCPLLTMNLADAQRFPPEIALLGFAYAVEMGGESQGERSVIDSALDRAAG